MRKVTTVCDNKRALMTSSAASWAASRAHLEAFLFFSLAIFCAKQRKKAILRTFLIEMNAAMICCESFNSIHCGNECLRLFVRLVERVFADGSIVAHNTQFMSGAAEDVSENPTPAVALIGFFAYL